jgi:hypothetical protein
MRAGKRSGQDLIVLIKVSCRNLCDCDVREKVKAIPARGRGGP